MKNKLNTAKRMFHLAFCLLVSLIAAMLPASAAVADASAGADDGIVRWLIILIAILFACILLLIGLTQWVRIRLRRALNELKALRASDKGSSDDAKVPEAPAKAPQKPVPEAKKEQTKEQPPEPVKAPAEEHTIAPVEKKEEKKVEAQKAEAKKTEAKKAAMTDEERSAAVAGAISSVRGDEKQEDDMSLVLVAPDGRRVLIKQRQSFRARMIQACDESKGYYSELKNYLLSFDGVVASDSWNYESYGAARRQLAKINITGKTIVLFLALDPASLEGSKYKFDDVGDRKRYEKTPVKLKIRSARSFKWAKELIDQTMAQNERAAGIPLNQNFVPLYEGKDALIARGLIQVSAQEVDTGKKLTDEEIIALIESGAKVEGARSVPAIDPAYADEYIPHVDTVTVEQAASLLDNTVAEHHLAHLAASGKKEGKQDIINVDTLDANFEEGDTVTLSKLKELKLVEPSTVRLKVLARGMLTKPLVVEAEDFSIDAVKMILLTGGTPVELD
ncbi:MAG: uL15 family ribosomal protein [Clostridia bacterium]|nr:uL15 family ribosomal protein [Clostridia bacterium]